MPYSTSNPQTLQEFLSKYASAIDAQGNFIPGKANLEYDGMNAADLYKQLTQGYPTYDGDGNFTGNVDPVSEVNADWIEDPRAKGWIGQHPKGALIAGTVLGGVGANMLGLLGTGSAGAAGAAEAAGGLGSTYAPSASVFGGGGLTAANAVGAGDLALASMPQAVGAGGTFAGGGALGGLGGVGASQTLGTVGKFLTDNPMLTKLGGAALGAALGGQDSTKTESKDPWAPAQPYLKANLERNQGMQDYYAKNPFSDQQKTAYQGILDTLANNQANAPVMQGIANQFMGSNRGLLGGMPQFTQGAKAPMIDWSKYANIGMKG